MTHASPPHPVRVSIAAAVAFLSVALVTCTRSDEPLTSRAALPLAGRIDACIPIARVRGHVSSSFATTLVETDMPPYLRCHQAARIAAFDLIDPHGDFDLPVYHSGRVRITAVSVARTLDMGTFVERGELPLDLALGETRANLTLNLQPVRDFHTTPYQRAFTMP
jgi:hypothetical protein